MFEHSGTEQLASGIVNPLPREIQCQLTVKKAGGRAITRHHTACRVRRHAVIREAQQLNPRDAVD
jgi:RNase P protein component